MQSNSPKILAQTAFLNAPDRHALRLRLTGHDQPRGIGDGGLQRLAGEEDDRRLHDGEDERQERRRDEAELDRGGAILPAAQSRRRSSASSLMMAGGIASFVISAAEHDVSTGNASRVHPENS